VILTLPSGSLEEGRARLRDPSQALVVEGAETRQGSVSAGLEHVETERVVVHDAARPLATPAMVLSVLRALDDADGAVTAVPVDDTLKRAHDGVVESTVSRSELWVSQTPQAFTTDVLKRAHALAVEESFVASDDAELVERYGGSVTVVPGSRSNIKITFADDFKLAEAFARTL
jgi:2-C-methyl-D-erythritol 4-phosphate cytidylyltransferase